MTHAGLVALVVLTGCRIGFDPIEGSAPDAGASAALGTIVTVTCPPDEDCLVECSLAASCVVDCNGASWCAVSCPAVGCFVTECDATCDVSCGRAAMPVRYGTTATCP